MSFQDIRITSTVYRRSDVIQAASTARRWYSLGQSLHRSRDVRHVRCFRSPGGERPPVCLERGGSRPGTSGASVHQLEGQPLVDDLQPISGDSSCFRQGTHLKKVPHGVECLIVAPSQLGEAVGQPSRASPAEAKPCDARGKDQNGQNVADRSRCAA